MIYNKELLVIIQALEDWCYYLQGAKHKFEIWTDHHNLSYFNKPQNLNLWQAHWHTYLQLFDYSLYVKPGNQIGKADILLRPPGLEIGENDNKNIQIFPDNAWIRSQPANNGQTSPPNPQEHEQILAAHHNNPLAGHPSIRKIFNLVQREYHWPNM